MILSGCCREVSDVKPSSKPQTLWSVMCSEQNKQSLMNEIKVIVYNIELTWTEFVCIAFWDCFKHIKTLPQLLYLINSFSQESQIEFWEEKNQ